MKKYCLPLLLCLFAFSCSKKDDPVVVVKGNVFINELLASSDDWLELYNSSDQAVDIGGYAIYDKADAKYMLPTGTSIPAKGYLLLYCDGLGDGLHTNFRLAAEGETVYLENSEGVLTDMVTFPALGANQSYGRYPDGSENLAITGSPSPGSANGNEQSPVITGVSRQPLVPRPENDVKIIANLERVLSTTKVSLHYKKNNGDFAELPMTALGGGVFEATIPKLEGAGTVSYYVEASHAENLRASYPATAPQETLQYLITTDALPQLFINEFLATNQTCCTDPAGQEEEYDDWIEIYNAGNEPVNLAGMYLSDNRQNPFKFKIPSDNASATTIPAKGFLLVWADEQQQQGPLHANFKLAAEGEDVGLYYLDGRTIDEQSFGPQTPDVSRGRSTNGGANWTNFNNPTPGGSNQ